MRKILSTAILLATGLLILAGYFFEGFLTPILAMVMDWGVVILGAAMLIGIGILIKKHFLSLFAAEKGSVLSAVTLIVFFFILISGLIHSTQNEFFSNLILNVQIPVEASLLAILAVTLFYASVRLIHIQGWTPLSIGFLVSAVVVLVLESNILPIVPGSTAAQIVAFARRLPLAGGRGLLLGIALGGLLVGLRVLLNLEHPYGEE